MKANETALLPLIHQVVISVNSFTWVLKTNLPTVFESFSLGVLTMTGLSFTLTWVNNSTGEEEEDELLYKVESLGTFQRVVPEWMRDVIKFSTSMIPVFFERVSRVIKPRDWSVSTSASLNFGHHLWMASYFLVWCFSVGQKGVGKLHVSIEMFVSLFSFAVGYEDLIVSFSMCQRCSIVLFSLVSSLTIWS